MPSRIEEQASNLIDAQKSMCNAKHLCKISDEENFLCRNKGHSTKAAPFAFQGN